MTNLVYMEGHPKGIALFNESPEAIYVREVRVEVLKKAAPFSDMDSQESPKE